MEGEEKRRVSMEGEEKDGMEGEEMGGYGENGLNPKC